MAKKQEVKFSEKQLVNLYGLLFKVAYADGLLDKDELRRIFEIINTEGFSEQGKSTIQNYLVEEPNIQEIVQNIKIDIKEIKYIAYLNSIEISICNDEVNSVQQKLLARLKTEFSITNNQDKEMRKFAQKAKEIADRGIDDKYAADTLKSGIAGLGAAGITSGLAALGLGFGMIPGIGIAIVIGTVIFIALSKLFDVGGKKQKKRLSWLKKDEQNKLLKTYRI